MSESGGLITARSAERLESREEHKIPFCWEKLPSPAVSISSASPLLALDDAQLPPAWPRLDAGEVLFAVLASSAPACLLHAIDEALGRGGRVYVLAAPAVDVLGQRKRKPQGRLLIRRVRELPASALLAERGRRAGICLQPSPDSPPRFWLPLSPRQGEALFAACLHLFWEHAVEESCLSDGALRSAPPLPAPFAAPLPAREAVMLSREPFPLCEEAADLCYLPNGELPASMPKLRTLLSPASGARQAELAALFRMGVRVAWRELFLPALYLGAAEGGLLLGEKGWRVRIRLEPEQVAGLRQQLEAAVQCAEYILRVDARLRELQGAVWLPKTTQPEQPPALVSLDAGTVVADTLSAVRTREPASWPVPPELARAVRYHFVVQPPRVPSAARPDPIVKEWQELDQRFGARCKNLDKLLVDAEQKESSLGKTFASLRAALLGHGNKRDRLKEKLKGIADLQPSERDPAGALALLDDLSAIERDAELLTKDLDDEERTAREQQAREEQEAVFQQRRQQAQRELDRCASRLDEVKKTLADVENQLSEAAAEKNPDEDSQVRMRKLEDRQRSLNKELATLEGLHEAQRDVLAESFVFQPISIALRPGKSGKSGKGAMFVPSETTPRVEERIPDEALPRTGTLLRHKQQRFVVIEKWKDLELGQTEADRLSARLIAPAEAS